jgi:catechol 2,3-dioxygenase-like lactoylglutathione lyase family enzyme
MSETPLFQAAFPYQDDVLALPVTDLDTAAEWYARAFGLTEVARQDSPPTVIMERDGVRIGFAVNGGDASQDGAAILVSDIERAASVLAGSGATVGERRVDTRDGARFDVFFVIAPDGLCYYLHQSLGTDA